MQSPAAAQVAQFLCLSVHSKLYFSVYSCTSSFSTHVPSASTAEHVFSSTTDAAASSTIGAAWAAAMPIKVMSAMALTVMVGGAGVV